MVDVVIISLLLLSSLVQLGATLGAVYFAYRITRIIGTFRAWTLVISAFVLLTLRNVSSLLLTLSLPPEQLASILEAIGPTGLWPSQLINIGASVLLLVGMYGLVKTFERQSNKSKER